MKAPFVSVVVPSFNEEKYINQCLDSILNVDYPKECMELILVDNGSTDATKVIAGAYDVKIIDRPNVKVGAVRNCGVENSKGEIVVFLDADCVVDKDWLTKGVEKLCNNSNSVYGGQYLLRNDPSWLERYWILNEKDRSVHLTTLVGGAIFVKKQDFIGIGGFDENLSAGEDSDLTERLREKGFVVEIEPSLSVVHLGYPSSIRAFLKRQVWHSSDYIDRLPASLKDKIFILTLLFIFGVVSAIFYLFSGNKLSGFLGLMAIFAPIVLSVKRISRSGNKSYSLGDIAAIYFIDFLYLVGRSGGVCRGLLSKFISTFLVKGKLSR